jgi:hypothetical protein
MCQPREPLNSVAATIPRQFPTAGDCSPGAAGAEQDDVAEDEAREALLQLDPLWDELFPAEQARIVHLLVERVDVRMNFAT